MEDKLIAALIPVECLQKHNANTQVTRLGRVRSSSHACCFKPYPANNFSYKNLSPQNFSIQKLNPANIFHTKNFTSKPFFTQQPYPANIFPCVNIILQTFFPANTFSFRNLIPQTVFHAKINPANNFHLIFFPANTFLCKNILPQTFFHYKTFIPWIFLYAKTLPRKHFFIQKLYPANIFMQKNL